MAEALAARARIAILEVQVLQAPHIAESGDAEMTRLESDIKAAAAIARTSLSRRNSDVRSLALSLGRKRTATAVCEDQLRALDDALATHHFTATR